MGKEQSTAAPARQRRGRLRLPGRPGSWSGARGPGYVRGWPRKASRPGGATQQMVRPRMRALSDRWSGPTSTAAGPLVYGAKYSALGALAHVTATLPALPRPESLEILAREVPELLDAWADRILSLRGTRGHAHDEIHVEYRDGRVAEAAHRWDVRFRRRISR